MDDGLPWSLMLDEARWRAESTLDLRLTRILRALRVRGHDQWRDRNIPAAEPSRIAYAHMLVTQGYGGNHGIPYAWEIEVHWRKCRVRHVIATTASSLEACVAGEEDRLGLSRLREAWPSQRKSGQHHVRARAPKPRTAGL